MKKGHGQAPPGFPSLTPALWMAEDKTPVPTRGRPPMGTKPLALLFLAPTSLPLAEPAWPPRWCMLDGRPRAPRPATHLAVFPQLRHSVRRSALHLLGLGNLHCLGKSGVSSGTPSALTRAPHLRGPQRRPASPCRWLARGGRLSPARFGEAALGLIATLSGLPQLYFMAPFPLRCGAFNSFIFSLLLDNKNM